jgi:hypothetical protein
MVWIFSGDMPRMKSVSSKQAHSLLGICFVAELSTSHLIKHFFEFWRIDGGVNVYGFE